MTNVVDVYINYLRRKVDSGYAHALIRTIRGVGYDDATYGYDGYTCAVMCCVAHAHGVSASKGSRPVSIS